MEDDPSAAREPVQPEVVQQAPAHEGEGRDGSQPAQEQVTQPTKLIRIASMVRNMLEEVRRAPIDDAQLVVSTRIAVRPPLRLRRTGNGCWIGIGAGGWTGWVGTTGRSMVSIARSPRVLACHTAATRVSNSSRVS